MESHVIFAALRDALANLYPEEQNARVVVDDAGLTATKITFSTRAETNWHNILAEALHQKRLDALLQIALAAYNANAPLLAAYGQYHLFISQGGYIKPPNQQPVNDGIVQNIKLGGSYVAGDVNTRKFIGRDEINNNYYGPVYSRLNYRNDIAGILDFYTKIFVGRMEIWIAIANFAHQKTPGYLLIEALPGYGKTALMAHLIHRWETGQWDQPVIPNLLYFFIRYEGGRNTPVAFLQALNSQLLDLLHGDGGVPSDLSLLRNQFSQLWAHVVAMATAEQPLLLIIDGLDEMATGETTIADELPAIAEANSFVHIIVSSRPNPKPLAQVAIDHPFKRASVYRLQIFTVQEVQALLQEYRFSLAETTALAPRIHAITKGEPLFVRFVSREVREQGEAVLAELEENPPVDIEAYFHQQFKQLAQQAEGELTWQILGLLSVTLGGITLEEIAEVLKLGNRSVSNAIKLIQRFLLGDQKMELMHLQLHKVVSEAIGKNEQADYRQKLLEWSQTYQQQGWPPKTPEYILSHYAKHLVNEQQWAILYQLIDQQWMKLKFKRTFAHRAFAEDIALAIAAAEQSTNWVQLVRNCLLYASLGAIATNVSPELLGVLTQLGQAERMLEYVTLIQDRHQQSTAYCSIAVTLLRRKEIREAKALLDQALAVAVHIPDEGQKADALSEIVQVLTQAGAIDQAITVANQALAVAAYIPDEGQKADALSRIAQALTQAGAVDQAITVANHALEVAKHIPDEGQKTDVLRRIMQFLISSGQDEMMRQQLRQQLLATHLAGRQAVFTELSYGIRALVTLDHGQTLWHVYEAIYEVDSWWNAK